MPPHPIQSPLADSLPTHLAERAHALNARDLNPDGDFVLCWVHHAIRDHENPALDAAIEIANRARKPLLVYQGLGGDHRFNSDRHHAFILQGARDLAKGLASRGIPYRFHLPTEPAGNAPDNPTPIRALIARAAAVVTEDFPAPPFPAWSAAHAAHADRAECAFLAVDAACLMPLRLLETRHDRAFKFRDKAKKQWRARINEPWTDATYEGPADLDTSAVDNPDLDSDAFIDPATLSDDDIAGLCARCRIDHSVPPVARSGGSVAGYARWDEFVRDNLGHYDKKRNDAADMDAVSCLSPYLHHGHVSPFRIAREAEHFGGPGAEKFLDELLVWREMAYNFCAHTDPDTLETLGVLPDWARKTLIDHAEDERDAIYTWETLARARTGDTLWDWSQKSLLINAELHNNIRMTWGKMIPRWKPTPEKALHDLIDLNHRFALDGNNPNSYGGLLWCLGRFDRPFDHDKPVTGTLRERTTTIHAKRLNTERYAKAVRSRAGFAPIRVAVMGGGVAGLACARTLRDQGCEVTVYDKGRSVGGRLSTRETDAGSFDHGAPAFGVTDERFARFVRSWIESGVCGVWRPTVGVLEGDAVRTIDEPRPLAVGTPNMTAVYAHLATDLQVETSTAVSAISRAAGTWSLELQPYKQDARTESGFDAVVLAGAAPQSIRLLAGIDTPVRTSLAQSESSCQWVLMAACESTVPDVLLIESDPAVRKIVREPTKPGRNGTARLVAHATPEWSRDRADADRADLAEELAAEVRRVLDAANAGGELLTPIAHRWGLARPTALCLDQCAWDGSLGLAACGDGFVAALGDDPSRIEDGVQNAFLSGVAAAGRVLAARPVRTDTNASADDQDAPSLFAPSE